MSVLRRALPARYSGQQLLPSNARRVAKDLIEFDKEWSAHHERASRASGGRRGRRRSSQRYFIKHGRYTAGNVGHLCPFRAGLAGPSGSPLAPGFDIGHTLSFGPRSKRLADAKPMELGPYDAG